MGSDEHRTPDDREPDRFSTSDPERAEVALQESYRLDGGARISRDVDDFSFSQETLTGRGFAATRFWTSATVEYWGPNDGLLAVEQVHAGRLSFDTARGQLHAGAAEVCMVPPHEPWRAITEDVDLSPLILDRDAVAAHAAAISGIEPSALVFTELVPISPSTRRYWDAIVDHVRDHVLRRPETTAAPLLQAEAFRMLAGGMLAVFPNTALGAVIDPEVRVGGRPEPAAVRRAVAFMDENAQRDIGISEIADASRIGTRGLQAAFRRHRGQTPLGYLRRVRMAGVHRDLQAADPTRGDTVAAITARWGFTHPGRFSVAYRRAYGCSPSETLRS